MQYYKIITHSYKTNKICNRSAILSNAKDTYKKQQEIHDFIYCWCTSVKHSITFATIQTKPFFIFLSGGAGVEKSHTVHSIHQSAIRILKTTAQNTDTPLVIVTASTGKAAVNIGGTTLHSAFNLQIRRKRESSFYRKTSAQTLNTQRCKYSQLK